MLVLCRRLCVCMWLGGMRFDLVSIDIESSSFVLCIAPFDVICVTWADGWLTNFYLLPLLLLLEWCVCVCVGQLKTHFRGKSPLMCLLSAKDGERKRSSVQWGDRCHQLIWHHLCVCARPGEMFASAWRQGIIESTSLSVCVIRVRFSQNLLPNFPILKVIQFGMRAHTHAEERCEMRQFKRGEMSMSENAIEAKRRMSIRWWWGQLMYEREREIQWTAGKFHAKMCTMNGCEIFFTFFFVTPFWPPEKRSFFYFSLIGT